MTSSNHRLTKSRSGAKLDVYVVPCCWTCHSDKVILEQDQGVDCPPETWQQLITQEEKRGTPDITVSQHEMMKLGDEDKPASQRSKPCAGSGEPCPYRALFLGCQSSGLWLDPERGLTTAHGKLYEVQAAQL